jgi:uncharacterized protein YbjT (DUF2867 family)
MEKDNFVPEVLVIGATGEVGRLAVRRLLLEGRSLYQGDLNNMESLEHALTDVDKIVFCAAAPRPDESDFVRTGSHEKDGVEYVRQRVFDQHKSFQDRQQVT